MLKRTVAILFLILLAYAILALADEPMRVPGDWQFKTAFWDWQFQEEEEEEAVDHGYGLIALVNNHRLRRMVDSLTLARIVGPRTE